MNCSGAGISERSEIESRNLRSSVCRIIDIDPVQRRARVLEDRKRRSRSRISTFSRPAASCSDINISVSIIQLDGGEDIVAKWDDIGGSGHFIRVSSVVVEFHRNDVVDPARGFVLVVGRKELSFSGDVASLARDFGHAVASARDHVADLGAHEHVGVVLVRLNSVAVDQVGGIRVWIVGAALEEGEVHQILGRVARVNRETANRGSFTWRTVN